MRPPSIQSQTDFQLFFQLPTHLFCVITPEGTFYQTNIAQKHILGWDPEELIGKPVANFVLPEDGERTFLEIGKLFQMPGEVIADFRNRCIHKNGGYRWISWSGSFLKDGIYCIGTDVTAEMEAQKAKAQAETRFHALFEQTPVALQIYSTDGYCIYANEAWEKHFETSRSELQNYNLFTDPQIKVLGFFPFVERAFQGEFVHIPTHLFEPALSGKAGRPRWQDIYLFPIKNELGIVQELAVMGLDTTDVVITRGKLAESELLFRKLADAIPQIVWVTNQDLTSYYYNQRWYDYTGQNRNDFEASSWPRFVHPEDLPGIDAEYQRAFKEGDAFECEYRLLRHDQTYRWHLGRSIVMKGPRGEHCQRFGTATDIHEKKEIQKTLEAAIQIRDNFLSIASHELRTPLSGLKLQTQLMKRSIDRGDRSAFSELRVKTLVDQTNRSIDRLDRLVDDMLDSSKIQTGKLEIHRQECNLAVLIQDVIDRYQPQLEKAEIATSLHIDETIDAEVDPFRFEQVLANLITNAIRYAPGGPFEVSLTNKENRARILVKDSGPGIPVKDHNRIFQRFERLVSANEVSGLGLGLYIAREIIEAHGGSIQVEDSSRRGTTFLISLPLLQQAET